MSTTTTIEQINWNADGLETEREQRAWRRAFTDYVANYPHCSLIGDEIIGPATYRFDGLNMQLDTPKLTNLKPLPEDGIYAEFQELHRDDWYDVVEQYMEAA